MEYVKDNDVPKLEVKDNDVPNEKKRSSPNRLTCPEGVYISRCFGDSQYKAYLPQALPIKNINISKLNFLLDKANVALGKLDGVCSILPNLNLFLYMYVKKEAVLSSQIEGTQSSLSDLLLFESGSPIPETIDDVVEVSNYVKAINYALKRMEELPLSLRLIKEIHKILLKNSRGNNKNPGEFRKSQNWIGGSSPSNAIYVPPPQEYLMEYLDNFERFLYDNTYPKLIKIAMCHAQFETIHPFLDGNGRMGRLLITLLLCQEKIINKPIVYLSLFFKENRELYYNLLQGVRKGKDWESWIVFFLDGINQICDDAINVTNDIFALFERDQKRIYQAHLSINLLSVFDALKIEPIVSANRISEMTFLQTKTALRMLKFLEKVGIVKEVTGHQRNMRFAYTEYLDILGV